MLGWVALSWAVEGVPDVLAMAEEMRLSGAPGNCVSLLEPIEEMVSVEQRAEYFYLRGFCAELAWDFAGARDDYLQVIAEGAGQQDEARFRLALVLEDLGDGRGALEQMTILHKNDGWDLTDQVAVDLEHALAEIAAGKTRRGSKHLDAALAVAQSWDKHPWLRAKALYVQIALHLDALDSVPLRGGDRRLTRATLKRVEGLKWAQEAMVPLVGIEEPEWILRGLYRLGTAYLALGEDLVASPSPAKLSREQAEVYRAELTRHQAVLRDKAAHVFDQGVQLALRLRFESPWFAKLELARDQLQSAGRAAPEG